MWTTPSRAHGALLVTPSLLYGSRCASVRWPCLLCSLCVLPGYYVWTPAPRGLPTTTSWATTDTSSRLTTSSLIRTKVLPLSLLVVSKVCSYLQNITRLETNLRYLNYELPNNGNIIQWNIALLKIFYIEIKICSSDNITLDPKNTYHLSLKRSILWNKSQYLKLSYAN